MIIIEAMRTVLVLVCALAALAFPAGAFASLEIGVSDQHGETFSDPVFVSSGMTAARFITPWDVISHPDDRLDPWLRAAQAAGIQPMIAFSRSKGSRCPYSPCVLPSTADYTAAVSSFHARYPSVTVFTPWNEVNDIGQPTYQHPAQAAAYYHAMVQVCPACTVLGADVIDNGTQEGWLSTFLQNVGTPPQLWGLHNYIDVNYFRSTGTESVLALVPGTIWLTETGGLVRYVNNQGQTTFPYDTERAARAEAFMLAIADAHPDRITRIYHFEWRSRGAIDAWDSALENPDGSPRPAFEVLRPRLPGRPASVLTGLPGAPGTVPGPASRKARATRPIVLTRSRRRARRLPLRVACLAPKGRRCRGTLRAAGSKRTRFSVRSGHARRVVLRGARRNRVAVRVTAPRRMAWSEVPRLARR
jgi:hypothetical protein